MSQVSTTKQLNQDDLQRLVGAPVTLVSGTWTATTSKTISSPVELATLQNAVNEYNYLPGEYNPRNAEENLMAFVHRVPAVLAGTDTFTAGDIQNILGWVLVAFHGAQIA